MDSLPQGSDGVQFGDLVADRRGQDASDDNRFRLLWDLGYRSILPIVPPSATLSEASSLFTALQKGRDNRGKAPGLQRPDGKWTSLPNWERHETTEADLERFNAMGAGAGLRGDGGLFWVDIDATDEATADAIERDALEMLGPAPMRVGSWPKRALLYQTTEPVEYMSVTFQGQDRPERVEIIGRNRQAVAFGNHQTTGRPYEWRRPLVPRDQLERVTREQLDAFLERQRERLPKAVRSQSTAGSNRHDVDQETLKAPVKLVERAVAAIPNTLALFPTRQDFVTMAIAIRAATIEDPDAGLEILEKWYERGECDNHDPDLPRRTWDSLTPPFSIGAERLFRLAREHGGANGQAAAAAYQTDRGAALIAKYFDPEAIVGGGQGGLFDVSSAPVRPAADTYDLLSIEDILALPDPVFLIDRHIPENSVGLLYGEPKRGKSFIALDWALHIAFGRPDWHGDTIRMSQDAAVIYIAGEGVSGIKTRIRAWKKRHGIPPEQRGRFQLAHQGNNFMDADNLMRLGRTLQTKVNGRVAFVVVDTVSRAIPGADENLQKDVTRFIGACDALKESFKCTVLGVHHASKKGDMRGSSVFMGNVEFVFKLERASGSSIGRLHCEKQKDAPDDWSETYSFDVVPVEGGSSLVPSRCTTSAGVSIPMTPTVAAAIKSAMQAAWDEGEPWGRTYHAKERHASRILARNFMVVAEEAEALVELWLKTGEIEEANLDKKRKKRGLRPVSQSHGATIDAADDGRDEGDAGSREVSSVFD